MLVSRLFRSAQTEIRCSPDDPVAVFMSQLRSDTIIPIENGVFQSAQTTFR